MNKKEWIKGFALMTALYLITNYIYHGDSQVLFQWIRAHNQLFLLNYVFFIGLSWLAIAIFNLKISSGFLALVPLILSLISYKKYTMRSSRLVLKDMLQVNEILSLANHVLSLRPVAMILIIFLLLLVSYQVMKRVKNISFELKERLLILIVGMSLVLFVNIVPVEPSLESKGLWLDLIKNNTEKIYAQGINPSVIENFELTDGEAIQGAKKQPNIVIIMSEGYWDLRKLKSVVYNKDLYKTFDQMAEAGVSGFLETPEFGGGTSNVEFELLTGHSAHFFPPGYVFYNEEKNRKTIASLPAYLKKFGYETTALHTYEGWFYNRESIYKSMGFDEFISSEDMSHVKEKGLYISDETITDYIVDILDGNEKSQFIFSITMQNHGPYNDKRYGDDQRVEVLSESPNKEILETYGQGIYDADQSLKKLYQYIQASDEKTMVVFFGDHLPVLGENFKVYKDEKFIDQATTLESKVKLSSVPFFIWTNFDDKKEKIELLNVSYLGSYLLDYLDINEDSYFKALSDLRKKLPVISRTYGYDEKNTLIEVTNEGYIENQERYRNLQFYILEKDTQINQEKR